MQLKLKHDKTYKTFYQAILCIYKTRQIRGTIYTIKKLIFSNIHMITESLYQIMSMCFKRSKNYFCTKNCHKIICF